MSGVQYPSDWTVAPLEQLIEFALGGDWGKDDDFNHPDYVPVRCIRASELRSWETEKGLTAAKRMIRLASFEKRELVDGDILVEVSGGGPEQPVGRTVLIDKSVLAQNPHEKKICTNFFRMLRLRDCVAPGYLNYYLQHFYKSGKISEYQAGSNNLRNLKFKDYIKISVPFPPLDVQKDIVAKIESLLSELDKGIESLKTAREQLKVYRQAVLKHAFEGKLTAQWREENKDKLESPEQLLARIHHEREARYQQQLEEWKAAVKVWEAGGNEGKKPGKPKPPTAVRHPIGLDLVQLPQGWCWIEYDGLCEHIRNGISAKPDGESGAKIFRISAVRAMEFDLNDVRYIANPDGEYDEYFLIAGDLVFTRYNGSRHYVGVCAEYRGHGDHLYPDKLIQTRLGVRSVSSTFLEGAISCGDSRRFIESRIRTTAGQSGVSGSDIREIPVPVCCSDEQRVIEMYLADQLSTLNRTAAEIERSLSRAEVLRQSVLKKAFEGQLTK